jgi:hypothetical protein
MLSLRFLEWGPRRDRAWLLCEAHGSRYGHRHVPGYYGQDIRPLLHDEEAGRRDGPRPFRRSPGKRRDGSPFPPPSCARWVAATGRVSYRNGRAVRLVGNENILKNGERVWVSWRNAAIKDGGGNIIGNLAHGIVKQHDGAITVVSEPGRGSTFALYFPQIMGGLEAVLGQTCRLHPEGHGFPTSTILSWEFSEGGSSWNSRRHVQIEDTESATDSADYASKALSLWKIKCRKTFSKALGCVFNRQDLKLSRIRFNPVFSATKNARHSSNEVVTRRNQKES